jgi:hypothetical protein
LGKLCIEQGVDFMARFLMAEPRGSGPSQPEADRKQQDKAQA